MKIKRLNTQKRMSSAVIYNNTDYLCGQVANDLNKGIKGKVGTKVFMFMNYLI